MDYAYPDLVEALEAALIRARAAPHGSIPDVARARALRAVLYLVNPSFPPLPRHIEVTALDGSHADAVELRGFDETTDTE